MDICVPRGSRAAARVDPDAPPAERAKNRTLFFDDLLDAKVREFNPRYAEAEAALLGQFHHLHADIYGNRADRASGRWSGLYLDGFLFDTHEATKGPS